MIIESLLDSAIDLWSFRNATVVAGALAAGWMLYSIGVIIYNVYFHPLSQYPGPWTRTGLLFFSHWVVYKGDTPYDARWLHEKYGDVVRMTPNALTFRTVQAMKDIYGPKPGPGRIWKDPRFYRFMSSNDIISANDEDHSRFRRLMSHAFSDSALQQQEPIMTRYFNLLIQRLHQRIDGPGNGVVDLVRWYNFTTFDVVGDLSFGESFDALERGEYHPWISKIFAAIKFGGRVGRIVRAWPPLMLLMRVVMALVPSIGRAKEQHLAFTREKTVRRLEAKTDRKDFMSYILRHNDERGMTREEIINNASILIIAGSETTATALSGATYFLLTNPEAYKRVQEEVRTAFARAEDMTLSSTGKLPYLHAVVEETLRMYPPVPGMLPRRTGAQGNVIDGHFVPPNTIVAYHQWAAYRAERNFRNPDAFVPERWLDEPPAAYRDDERAALKPFSFGPRNCLGQHMAYSEMRSILARMLWHFEMELCDESRNWIDQKVHILWQKPVLKVKLSRRFRAKEEGL